MYSDDNRQSPYLLCTPTEKSLREKNGRYSEGVYIVAILTTAKESGLFLLIPISVTGFKIVRGLALLCLLCSSIWKIVCTKHFQVYWFTLGYLAWCHIEKKYFLLINIVRFSTERSYQMKRPALEYKYIIMQPYTVYHKVENYEIFWRVTEKDWSQLTTNLSICNPKNCYGH
jgi:hypothetical protein